MAPSVPSEEALAAPSAAHPVHLHKRRPPEADPVVALDRDGLGRIFAGRHLRDDFRPNFSRRRVGERYLVTSPHGTWMVLDEAQMSAVDSIAVPDALFDQLEAAGLIVTEANAVETVRAWRRWCSHHFTGTSLHILGVTRRCNLKCSYCHAVVVPDSASIERYDMSIAVGRRIVDFAFQSPSSTLHFEFQGGEATLNPELVRSVTGYAKAKNLGYKRALSFSLVSNLVDVDPDFLEWLQADGVRVTTTLELEEEQPLRVDHAERGRTADVERARAFMSEHGSTVPWLMVMARNNVHRAREYIDHAVAHGQRRIFLAPVQYLGLARKHWDDVGIDTAEYLSAWTDAMEYMFELWDRGVFIMERQFALAVQKLFSRRDVRYMDFRNPNGMVLGNLAYDQHGNVFACDEGRAQSFFRVGNVFESDYGSLVSGDRARRLVSYSLRERAECDTCSYKPYCGVEPIVSHAMTGDPDPRPGSDPACLRTQGVFDFVFDLIVQRPERIRQSMFVEEVLSGG